jgi:hypothetical protein
MPPKDASKPGGRKQKAKKNKPKRADTLDATVIIIEHEWAVLYVDSNGDESIFDVTDTDAWNFDIERGLKVQITVDEENEGFCKIHSKQGNKKYVTIDKMEDTKGTL